MYESLGREAAALITTDSILAAWGVERAQCDVPMLRLGFQDDTKESGVAPGPTIIDWLDSIVGDKERKGEIRKAYREQDQRFMDHYAGSSEFREGTRGADSKDLLSRGDVAYSNVSMGLMGMDRKEDVPLAVVEFRQFPSDTSLQVQYWDTLAERLYQFYDQARHAESSEGLLQQVSWSKDVIGDGWRKSGPPGTVALRRRVETLRQKVRDDAQNARAQRGKTRSGTLKGLIDSFTETYAELRGLFLELEPTHGAREERREVPGRSGQDFGQGGDCLFDSTSAGLAGALDAATLRLYTSDQVRQNPFEYVNWLVNTGSQDDVLTEMEDATDFLEVPGNWNGVAGDIAPIALGDVLANHGHQLVILNQDGSIRYSGPNGGPSVFIYYNGRDHYTPSA